MLIYGHKASCFDKTSEHKAPLPCYHSLSLAYRSLAMFLALVLLTMVQPCIPFSLPPPSFLLLSPNTSPTTSPTTLLASLSSDDLATQKREAAESYIAFNDGDWKGTCTAINVTSLLQSNNFPPSFPTFSHTLTAITEITKAGINTHNTLEFPSSPSSPSRYVSKVSDPSFDVDAVDGSFSTDHSIISLAHERILPTSRWAVESSIAFSDTERSRALCLYDFSSTLQQILLFTETRDLLDQAKTFQDEVLAKISSGELSGDADRLDALRKAAESGKTKLSADDAPVLEVTRYAPTLRELTDGTWIGDGVVRNRITTKPKEASMVTKKDSTGKGFGHKPKAAMGAGLEDGFAQWSLGVFKTTTSTTWDQESKRVRVQTTLAPALGAAADSTDDVFVMWGDETNSGVVEVDGREQPVYTSKVADGTLLLGVGEFQVRTKLVIDEDVGGDGDGDADGDGDVAPFKSEFSLFQQREEEIFCSKLARLHARDGSLKQGSNVFFSWERLAAYFI